MRRRQRIHYTTLFQNKTSATQRLPNPLSTQLAQHKILEKSKTVNRILRPHAQIV